MLDARAIELARAWLSAWLLASAIVQPAAAAEPAQKSLEILQEAEAAFLRGDWVSAKTSAFTARQASGLPADVAERAFRLEIEASLQLANNQPESNVKTKAQWVQWADRAIEDMLKYPGLRGVEPNFQTDAAKKRLADIRRERFGSIRFAVDPPSATVVLGADTLKSKDGTGQYFETDLPRGYALPIKVFATGYVPLEDVLQINAGQVMTPRPFRLSRTKGRRWQIAGGAAIAASLVVLGAVVGRDKPQSEPAVLPDPPVLP